jgi:hypothetical protein
MTAVPQPKDPPRARRADRSSVIEEIPMRQPPRIFRVTLSLLAAALATGLAAKPAPPPPPPPPPPPAALVIQANRADAASGWAVALAGDVNNDGRPDVIVGAPKWTNGEYHEGAVFLYLGTAQGLSTTPAWQYESNQVGACLGAAVARAGKVNGDAYGDIIVGAPWYDNAHVDAGRAYVFFGKATGLNAQPAWTADGDQDGALFGFSVGSSQPSGSSVAVAAGSFNGDNYADVVVGAPDYDDGQRDEGEVFVYHGSATGPAATPSRRLQVNKDYAELGRSLAGVGRTNNDAYLDLLVGAGGYDVVNAGAVVASKGLAAVFYGSSAGVALTPSWSVNGDAEGCFFGSTVASAGDLNNDGYGDFLVAAWPRAPAVGGQAPGYVFAYKSSSSGPVATPLFSIQTPEAVSDFGYALGSAGDWNGDTVPDILVGAPLHVESGQFRAGRVAVYKGNLTGAVASAPLYSVVGIENGGLAGFAVSSAGDLNNDGKADILIGEPGRSLGDAGEGVFNVQFGRP